MPPKFLSRRIFVLTFLALLALSIQGSAQWDLEPLLGEPPRAPDLAEPLTPRRLTVPSQPSLTGNWIDVSRRETVRLSYNNLVQAISNVPAGWTGDVVAGIAGSTSEVYRNAILTNLNWYRGMAGVPPVTLDASLFPEQQEAALMMSANRRLSHTPDSSWLFYTEAGARAAGRSNLAIGNNTATDPGAIAGYVTDFGPSNTAVGHRRWIFLPQSQQLSTGDVPAASGFPSTNALRAWDSNLRGTRPATRDPFVAWPPNGYLPYQLLPNRWSFSLANGDFSNATVTATRLGTNLSVAVEPLATGFGENTIVFALDGVPAAEFPRPQRPASDTATIVNIRGIRVGNQIQEYTYIATFFDPGTSGPVSGPPAVPAQGVVHGATLRAAEAISPNGFGSVFGTNLATATRSWDLAFQDGRAPTDLDGTRVLVNGKPAFISYVGRGADFGVSYDQVNFLVPESSVQGSVEVVVSTPSGRSDPLLVSQARRSPAFFPFEPQGRRYIAAIENSGLYFVGPSDLFGGPVNGRPVQPTVSGGIVQFYGTAFGDVNPPVPVGELNTGISRLTDTLRVFIGPAEAEVLFAGLSAYAGVYQIVVRVPNLPPGEYPVHAEIGGQRTPDGLVLAIGAAQ